MAVVLIDDLTLARILRGERVREVARNDVSTTGLWYLRLCSAIERANGGRLSGPFVTLSEHRQRAALDRVRDLPNDIAVLPLRTLAPAMARLQQSYPRLNLLGREIAAAAQTFPARVLVAPGNIGPYLAAALADSRNPHRETR